jgi:TPR repeat protein
MSTTRIAPIVAVLAGSLLGSLAAALSVAWSPSLAPASASFEPPFEPIAAPPPEPRGETASSPASPAKSAAPAPPTVPSAKESALELEGPLPAWLEQPLPAEPEAAARAALNCARGNADDCMRAGDAYEAGHGTKPNERQARLNRVAGRRLFDQACQRRHPQACYSLAVIYSLGLGVSENPKAAEGQMTITRRLCRTSHDDICQRLAGVDAE